LGEYADSRDRTVNVSFGGKLDDRIRPMLGESVSDGNVVTDVGSFELELR
jgi:hypothetical protein